MTLKEFYEKTGGDFEQVLARMLTEERVKKYVMKFLNDESLNKIKQALDDKNYKDAFLHTHNLKGVCLNLSFNGLLEPVVVLCEELRNGNPQGDVDAMYVNVEYMYNQVRSAIENID